MNVIRGCGGRYGDVSAVNDTERIVSVALMLLGVTIFGYTLLMVAYVLNDGDPRDAARKAKMLLARMCHWPRRTPACRSLVTVLVSVGVFVCWYGRAWVCGLVACAVPLQVSEFLNDKQVPSGLAHRLRTHYRVSLSEPSDSRRPLLERSDRFESIVCTRPC